MLFLLKLGVVAVVAVVVTVVAADMLHQPVRLLPVKLSPLMSAEEAVQVTVVPVLEVELQVAGLMALAVVVVMQERVVHLMVVAVVVQAVLFSVTEQYLQPLVAAVEVVAQKVVVLVPVAAVVSMVPPEVVVQLVVLPEPADL